MARRFLSGLTVETKASAASSGAIARATGSSPGAAFSAGLGLVGQWDIDTAVQRGLERVIWIARCCDVIAANQAKVTIRLRKGYERRTGRIVAEQELWKLLNFRANSYEMAWQFRYRLSVILLLARRGAFVEVVYGQDKRPSELHLLPPGTTEPIPDPKKFVKGYRVTRSDYQVDELPPERVLWLRLKPHPTDPYAQMTPLVAAGLEADTDFLARLFNRNFLANDGRPGMLITIDGGPAGVSPEDRKELKERFGGGPAYAGRTTVIEGTNINAQDLGANPRDVQWNELLTTSKERLLLAFGVPESVMGNASGRTYDNADAERENFWIDTMQGHCDAVAGGLDPLTGETDDDLVFAFDYDEVDVLQRKQRERRDEWRAEFAAGLITLNDYLDRVGNPQINSPGARVYYLPNGVPVAVKPEEQEAVNALATIGGGKALPPGPEQAARRGASQGAGEGMRQLNNVLSSRVAQIMGGKNGRPRVIETKSHKPRRNVPDSEAKLTVIQASVVEKVHPYTGLRHRLEGGIEGVVTAWDQTQEKVVCERMFHVKSRKGTRHWDGEVSEAKAIDPSYSVDLDEWETSLQKSIRSVVEREMRSEYASAMKQIRNSGLLDVVGTRRSEGEKALENVLRDVLGVVGTAAENQSDRVRRVIAQGDREGKSLRQVEQEVRALIGTRSAWRKQLATNVVTTAIEGARAAAWGTVDKYVTKTWNYSLPIEKVRPTHRAADGQSVSGSKAFSVGGSRLRYPGDPLGAPQEVINCRCYLTWSIDEKTLNR